MSKKFNIEDYASSWDKVINIQWRNLTITVDYDDVDHDKVIMDFEKLISLLGKVEILK